MSIKQELEKTNKKLKNEVDKNLKKVTLLLDAPKDTNYNIREQFGWNKDIHEAENDLGNLIENKKYIESCEDNKVILQSEMEAILVKNNYKLTKLKDYNSKITPELLDIIDKYFQDNPDLLIGSDFNKDKLFIASPLLGGGYQEKAKSSSELLVFENITDIRYNNQRAYKIIGRCGKTSTIWNTLKAFFFTHTRQINAVSNTALFLGLFILLFLIVKFTWYISRDQAGYSIEAFLSYGDYFLYQMVRIVTVTLALKFFVFKIHYCNQNSGDLSFNYYDDKGYTNLVSTDKFPKYPTSTAFIKDISNTDRYGSYNPYYTLKGKVLEITKTYNRIGKFLLLLVIPITFYLIQIFPLALTLNLKKLTIQNGTTLYESTGLFTYKTREVNKIN